MSVGWDCSSSPNYPDFELSRVELTRFYGMLVPDSFQGHIMANVKRALCYGKTGLVVIPDKTSVPQPLHIILNEPSKN